MNVFYVKCLKCDWKFPYNSYDSNTMKALMENPCKNCGALIIVDESTYLLVKNAPLDYHQNIIVNEDDSITTTYSTSDGNTGLSSEKLKKSITDAIKKFIPLSKELKQSELKTEFLKNKWWW